MIFEGAQNAAVASWRAADLATHPSPLLTTSYPVLDTSGAGQRRLTQYLEEEGSSQLALPSQVLAARMNSKCSLLLMYCTSVRVP
jgi:hypothetical protein